MTDRGWTRLAWVLTIAIMAIGVLLFQKLHLGEDVTALLPDGDPVVRDYRQVVDNFRILDAVFIDIGGQAGDDGERHMIQAGDRLQESLAASNLFERILYRFSGDRMLAFLQKLPQWRPCLFSPEDLQAMERSLEPQRVSEKLTSARRALLEPTGPFVRDRIRHDPLGIDGAFAGKIEALSPTGRGMKIAKGLIWSEDGRHILMIAVPKFRATDTGQGRELIEMMDGAIAHALEGTEAGAVRISYCGVHRASLDNSRAIQSDVSRTATATLIGIALAGVLFFRRKWLAAIIFLPPFIGSVVAAAAFAVFDPVVSAITVGCGAALIGNAVDYGITVLYHRDSQSRPQAARAGFMRQLYLPLGIAALTTIGALLCLRLSSLPGQRQMGLYAAIGVLGTVIYAALVLPMLFGPARRNVRRPVISLDRCCNAFLKWRRRHEKSIWTTTILILAVSLVGLTRLRFEGDVTKLNKTSPATKADEERFLSVWGDSLSVSAIVEGRDMEEALRANDRLADELVHLRQEKKIRGFTSIAPMFPSREMQNDNLRRWREFWTHQRLERTQELLVQAGSQLKFTPQAFDPFFASLEANAQPISLADFEESDLADMLNGCIAHGQGGYMVMSQVYLDDPALLAEVQSRLTQTGAAVLNRKTLVEHMVGMVRDEVKLLGAAACAVVLVLLFLLYGRVELVLAVFAPVVLAIVVTLGSLGLFGVPLNLMSCLFVVFVLGMGIDYSIFLMSQRLSLYWGKGGNEAGTVGAVLLAAVTSAMGFAAMCTASHPALFSLGLTGLIGMTASMAGAIVIVPTVADRLLSERGNGRSTTCRTLLGGLYVCLYLCLASLAYLLVLRFLIGLRYRHQSDARQRFARAYIRRVFNGLRLTFPSLHSRRILLAASPATFQRPGVIVANHLALADLMMVLSLPCDMVLAVKRWVWDSWIMGSMVREAGYILLDEDGSEAFFRSGMEHLTRGTCVMVFPEGTRSPDGRIHRFRNGAFELAIQARSDIIPLLVTNTQSGTLPRGGGIGDHNCLLRVLPRITPQSLDYSQGARALAIAARETLLEQQPTDWRLSQQGKTFWRNIRSLYNYAGGYVESYAAWKMRLDPLYSQIDSLVAAEGTVLDLGCGHGLMSLVLARKSLNRSVIGVDYDSRKIDIARRAAVNISNVSFLVQDLRKWTGVPAVTVLLVDVLHYWPQEQQEQIIASACQSLDHGGMVIFRDGCRSGSWKHRLVVWGERFSTGIGHNHSGGGLHFASKEFYINAFRRHGLVLQKQMDELGPGSNVVLILTKEPHA